MNLPGRNEPCLCGSGKKYKKCCFSDDYKNGELKRAIKISSNIDEVQIVLSEKPKLITCKVMLISMGLNEINEEISRTIEMNDRTSLYSLHLMIQSSFGWDNDHMFSFYMGEDMDDVENEYSGNPLGGHHVSDFGSPTKAASDTELRDLNLKVGREFIYLYDYGDRLIHKIVIQDIKENENIENKSGRIISKIGNSPAQYEE
jgi:hypothetical protein